MTLKVRKVTPYSEVNHYQITELREIRFLILGEESILFIREEEDTVYEKRRKKKKLQTCTKYVYNR